MGTVSYQWQRDGQDIDGAVNGTYQLTQDDVGSAITVVASYTDGQNTKESETSAATSLVVSENIDGTLFSAALGARTSTGTFSAFHTPRTGIVGDGVEIENLWFDTFDFNVDVAAQQIVITIDHGHGFGGDFDIAMTLIILLLRLVVLGLSPTL